MKKKINVQHARGLRNHRRGVMNKTEEAYAEELKSRGDVVWFEFEGIRFKVGANTAFYTPDFAVMLEDGTLEMHEVKGFWQIAAKVRIKSAAMNYPIRFIAVQKKTKKDGGGWKYEVFGHEKGK